MTNEEAIAKLTNIMHDDHYAWHPSILEAFRMAVDALRGADGDCISRQTLKEAFVETSLLEWEQLKKCYPMLKVVDEVPSAQPTHGNTPNALKSLDCIDRQAAMDIAEDIRDRISIGGYWEWIERLKRLPSAQPEQLEQCPIYGGVCGYPSDKCYECPRHNAQPEQPITCKDCKYWEGVKRWQFWNFEQCSLNQHVASCDDYCSFAERKEGTGK